MTRRRWCRHCTRAARVDRPSPDWTDRRGRCLASAWCGCLRQPCSQARPERPPRVGAVPMPGCGRRRKSASTARWTATARPCGTSSMAKPRMHVFMSFAGTTRRSEGLGVDDLTPALDVAWTTRPEQGVWMEAVVADDAGTWYGYYHNERAGVECGDTGKVMPRIGAARSFDRGVTWEDLGPVLEAPPGTSVCDTTNHYFHGGVGDRQRDARSRQAVSLHVLLRYLADLSGQGVAMARMAWANRDAPAGRVRRVEPGGVDSADRRPHSRGSTQPARRCFRRPGRGTTPTASPTRSGDRPCTGTRT